MSVRGITNVQLGVKYEYAFFLSFVVVMQVKWYLCSTIWAALWNVIDDSILNRNISHGVREIVQMCFQYVFYTILRKCKSPIYSHKSPQRLTPSWLPLSQVLRHTLAWLLTVQGPWGDLLADWYPQQPIGVRDKTGQNYSKAAKNRRWFSAASLGLPEEGRGLVLMAKGRVMLRW